MSRTLRSNISVTTESLKPRLVDMVTQNLRTERQKQKRYSDRGSVSPVEFEKGQAVLIQNNSSRLWQRGEVLKELEQPRSYKVQLAGGSVLRRNVRDIKSVKGIPTDVPMDPIEDSQLTNVQNSSLGPTQLELDAGESNILEDPPSNQLATIDSPKLTRSGRPIRMRRLSDFIYEFYEYSFRHKLSVNIHYSPVKRPVCCFFACHANVGQVFLHVSCS